MTVGDGVWAVVGDEPRVSFRSEVRAPPLPLCPCSVSEPPSEPRWQIPRGRPRTPARCVPFLTEGRGEPGCRIPSHAIPVLISERPPRGLPRATRILPRSAYVIFTYPTPARVTYRSQRGSHCTCSPGDISLQVLETHTGKD